MPRLVGKLILFFISLACSGIFFSLNTHAQTTGSVDVFVNVPQGLIPTVTPTTTTPTPPNPGPGFIIPNPQPFSIYDVVIKNITPESAEIDWKTDQLATSEVYYGATTRYELGSQPGLSFLFNHQIFLTKLKPRTTYHFLISSQNLTGATALAGDFTFTTPALPDNNPPLPIRNFQIFPGDSQLILIWQNPPDLDLAGVKIYRHTSFYPTNLTGELIFSGLVSSFVNKKLTNGQRYFYTIYAYDWSGNMSSGVSQSGVPQVKSPALPLTPTEPFKPRPGAEEIPPWLFHYFINTTLPLQLNEAGSIEALVYDQVTVNIPIQIFSKKIERATIFIKDTATGTFWTYPFNIAPDGQSWFVNFIAPDQSGRYQTEVEIIFTNQSQGYSRFFISVFPNGKIKNGWLPNKLIGGSVALLYVFNPEAKTWQLWPTNNIWQANPQVTEQMGEYGFSVPNGKYYLIIHKEGYWTKVLSPFDVTNQRINFNIALWPIIPFWWVMVILGLLGLWQYFRKKQYQSLLRKIRQR